MSNMIRQVLQRSRSVLSLQKVSAYRPLIQQHRSKATIVVNSNTTTTEEIVAECAKIRESIQSLNDRYKGPLEKSSQKNTILPYVLLIGNHSSGKSSFVNYVCGRKIQAAGVAPTDDMFTIIVPGPADVDRDGPSLIGDPDIGFAGLRSYGPALIHRTKLKVRSNTKLENFMLVDTPGMIDSPMIRDQFGVSRYAAMDRGYNFESVCNWFAERADVILLFFDPDKPGTTGETLSILTNSLTGMDHKLHIILNKADQFRKIHDFARAYGSLCWNLSKVIQRKDLPSIYPMCLPKVYREGEDISSYDQPASLGGALADLEENLIEIVHEVHNAPKRRVDNEITRLTYSISLLQMHLNIVDDLVKQLRNTTWQARVSLAAAAVGSAGAITTCAVLGMPIEVTTAVAAATLGGSGLLFYLQNNRMVSAASNLVTDDAMVSAYKRLYARKISGKDEYLSSLWTRVHDHLVVGLSSVDLKSMEKVRSADLSELDKILEYDIPNLRRKSAPAFSNTFANNNDEN